MVQRDFLMVPPKDHENTRTVFGGSNMREKILNDQEISHGTMIFSHGATMRPGKECLGGECLRVTMISELGDGCRC